MRALLLALLLVPFVLAGCDSADDGPGATCTAAGLTATGSLTATADGSAFSALCLSGQLTSGVLSVAGFENLGVAGASQRQINLNVPMASAGTFQVGPTGAAVATYADVDLANPTAGTYAGISGSVTVDVVSATSARGSFSFTARNNGGQQVQVTGGSFDVTF